MPSSPSMDTPTARGIHGSDQPVTKARPQTHQPIHLSKSKLTRPQHQVHRQRGSTRYPSDLHYLPATTIPVHDPAASPNPLDTSSWWRRTGSNRRPPACKAGALPAELRPHQCMTIKYGHAAELVGQGGLEPPTPRLSSVCSNQLSY